MTADTITAIKKTLMELPLMKVEFSESSSEGNSIISPTDDFEDAYFTVIGCGEKQDELGRLIALSVNSMPVLLSTLESLHRENQGSKELARAFEAEANQLREVSIANRHRADRAEAELKRLEEWKPISEADTSITNTITMPGLTIRNSDSYWVRDDDGRVYEACWTDHRNGYWWDIEGESPVDPVEFMPHPLSRTALSSTGDTHGN